MAGKDTPEAKEPEKKALETEFILIPPGPTSFLMRPSGDRSFSDEKGALRNVKVPPLVIESDPFRFTSEEYEAFKGLQVGAVRQISLRKHAELFRTKDRQPWEMTLAEVHERLAAKQTKRRRIWPRRLFLEHMATSGRIEAEAELRKKQAAEETASKLGCAVGDLTAVQQFFKGSAGGST